MKTDLGASSVTQRLRTTGCRHNSCRKCLQTSLPCKIFPMNIFDNISVLRISKSLLIGFWTFILLQLGPGGRPGMCRGLGPRSGPAPPRTPTATPPPPPSDAAGVPAELLAPHHHTRTPPGARAAWTSCSLWAGPAAGTVTLLAALRPPLAAWTRWTRLDLQAGT